MPAASTDTVRQDVLETVQDLGDDKVFLLLGGVYFMCYLSFHHSSSSNVLFQGWDNITLKSLTC